MYRTGLGKFICFGRMRSHVQFWIGFGMVVSYLCGIYLEHMVANYHHEYSPLVVANSESKLKGQFIRIVCAEAIQVFV